MHFDSILEREGLKTRKVSASVAIIFVIAFAARLVYVLAGSQELTFDEPYYDHIASQLSSGHGFTFSFSAWFTSIPNEPTSVQEPLYPLFLAGIKVLSGSHNNYLVARIIQSLIGALLPVIVAWVGSHIFGRESAFIAGGILALYPPLIYYNRLLMTETLYTFLLVTTVLLASTQNRTSTISHVVVGFVFGLACLTRSILLGFMPLFLLWIWLTTDASKIVRTMILSLTTVGVLLAVGPWTIRNYFVHKAFVPIATKGGWNIYFYNYPIANFDFNDRWADIPVPDMQGLSEVEREKEYTKRAIGFIHDNPLLITSFALVKLKDFWNPFLKGGKSVLSLLNIVSYGVMTLFAWAGLFRCAFVGAERGYSAKQKVHTPMFLMYLLIGFYLFQAMIFTGGSKARLPIEPLLVLLGAEAMWSLIAKRISLTKQLYKF